MGERDRSRSDRTAPSAASPSRLHPDYVRSVMFGVEDGLVSTSGAVVGVAAGTRDADVVVLAGVVIVVVEAMSMAVGQLLSERAVHQLEPSHEDSPLVGSLLMFGSYLLAGMVPVLPVAVSGSAGAVLVGVGLALAALFILGYVKGRLVSVPALRSGVEVLALGGATTVVGLALGVLLRA